MTSAGLSVSPAFDAFAATYVAGRQQVVWIRVIDDLETPVSAFLKIGHGQPYAFLFESVEGGAWRGRYSAVALEPDLVWRAFGERAEIAEGADIAAGRFHTDDKPTLASLRAQVAACRMDLPTELPPMAAGLFGVLGYDMIRLAEPLGPAKPDVLELPDAVMMRPSVVAIFDSVGGEIVLVAPVRPDQSSAEAAYAAAKARLQTTLDKFRAQTPPITPLEPSEQPEMISKTTREDYRDIVGRARRYIEAGDIFQVVPSHRFSRPFAQDGFSLYRSSAPPEPLTLPLLSELRRVRAGRLQSRDSGAPAGRQAHHPPHRRHPPPRQDTGRGSGAGGRTPGRSQGTRRAPDVA